MPLLLRINWLLLYGALLGVSQYVAAHTYAKLDTMTPAPNSIVDEIPERICIDFTGIIQPRLSRLFIRNASNEIVSEKSLDNDGAKRLCAVLGSDNTPAGNYRVEWSAVGRDGHRISDHYVFTLEQ